LQPVPPHFKWDFFVACCFVLGFSHGTPCPDEKKEEKSEAGCRKSTSLKRDSKGNLVSEVSKKERKKR
jgi:hypothetical protein